LYLKRITLENYRSFDLASINFHKRLTVLVGNDRAGKTTILDSISVALSTLFVKMDNVSGKQIKKEDAHLKRYTLGDTNSIQAQYPVRISAEGILNDKFISWSRSLNKPEGSTTLTTAKEMLIISSEMQQRLRQGDVSLKLPFVAYYGMGQSWNHSRKKRTNLFMISTRTNGYIGSLNGSVDFGLMTTWFLKMTIQKYQRNERGMTPDPALNVVFQVLRDCFTNLTGFQCVDIFYSLNENELQFCYFEKDGIQKTAALDQLAVGHRNTICLIADIAYRMATLNPQLLGDVLKETEGIVLIDEIDQNLSPSEQKCTLMALLRIFPKIQFIASTHNSKIRHMISNENLIMLTRGQNHQ